MTTQLTDLTKEGVPIHTQIAREIFTAIKEKRIDINNAMTLVAFGMKVMDRFKKMPGAEKASTLQKALEEIAKGPDGQFGTDDDVIPPVVWKGIETLLNADLLKPTMDMFHQIRSGKMPDVEQTKTCLLGCFSVGKQVFDAVKKTKK